MLGKGGDLYFFLYKLYNAINTNRFAGLRINEHICRVHIFKVQSVANIVHTIAVSIVMKAFGRNHLVNLRFCGKSLTTDIRLRENNAEQAIRVSRKANSGHLRFRKQSIVEHSSCLASISQLLGLLVWLLEEKRPGSKLARA